MKAARATIACIAAVFATLAVVAGHVHAEGSAENSIVSYQDTDNTKNAFIMDVRREDVCLKASLPGARCLPASDILGPHKRLPNFSGLRWLLGTIGLSGDEHVVVAGGPGRGKEFAAGLLLVSGQRKITVLTSPISSLPSAGLEPGSGRTTTREQVYQAAVRDDYIILRNELAAAIADNRDINVLDARSENEYWGKTLRTVRGGHIPGATLLPNNLLQAAIDNSAPVQLPSARDQIVYGHNTYDGLVALARLAASGVEAKVLYEGWVGWALDGSLPAGAVVYADLDKSRTNQDEAVTPDTSGNSRLLVVGIVLAVAAFAAGYAARWLTSPNKG